MAGEHPTDLTLLAYVEDELDADARVAVEAHVAECEACAADIRLAQAGRDAAREAPVLEAPAGLSGRVVGEITPLLRQRAATGRRWLRIVAPVAAALAIAGGIATLAVYAPGGGDNGEAGEGAAVAEEAGDTGGGELAPADSGTTGGEAAPSLQKDEAFTLGRFAADPEALASELRRAGFKARVKGATVVVTTNRTADLRRALRDYPSGSVSVRVE